MALGAAFFVSMIGGLFGAVVLFGTLSIARPLVLALGSPELFMLAVFGLSMVGILSTGSPLAGIVSALFGLIVGTIGGAPGVPVYRYTFEWLYLFDGSSEEHTSELQSLMRTSYAVLCLQKKNKQ